MYIGIDIGGMSIKAGIVNDKGEIVEKRSVITPLDGNDSFMKGVLKAIELVLEAAQINKEKVKSIGIGYPGSVDRESGILLFANNIPGKDIKIKEFLQKEFGKIPVNVENDANCAALGEYYANGAEGDFIFVTLGTGIGGGIVIGKKLYLGVNGIAGELGHIITHHGGRKCSCGRRGCWEEYASVTALKNITEENKYKIKSIKTGERISGRTAFEYAKKGDKEAIRVRDEWIEEVAIGITDIVNIFQPQKLVIGGAISKEGDTIINPVRKYVEQNGYDVGNAQRTLIKASDIGGDAGIIGAAFL